MISAHRRGWGQVAVRCNRLCYCIRGLPLSQAASPFYGTLPRFGGAFVLGTLSESFAPATTCSGIACPAALYAVVRCPQDGDCRLWGGPLVRFLRCPGNGGRGRVGRVCGAARGPLIRAGDFRPLSALSVDAPCPPPGLRAGPFHNRVRRNRHSVTSVTRTCDALHTGNRFCAASLGP